MTGEEYERLTEYHYRHPKHRMILWKRLLRDTKFSPWTLIDLINKGYSLEEIINLSKGVFNDTSK